MNIYHKKSISLEDVERMSDVMDPDFINKIHETIAKGVVDQIAQYMEWKTEVYPPENSMWYIGELCITPKDHWGDVDEEGFFTCPKCNTRYDHNFHNRAPYCEMCGTKMLNAEVEGY